MIPSERITRAKIQLQTKNPFFSYLSLFLKIKEDTEGRLPEHAGMGVDIKGNLTYKAEFVDKLTDDELLGVLTHEICHLAFLHLIRKGSRDMFGWNCATDLAINTFLKLNGFRLPHKVIIADNCGEFKIQLPNGKEKIIEDCDKKTAEEIYDELPKIKQDKNKYVLEDNSDKQKGGGDVGQGLVETFDEHIQGDEKGKGMSENEKKELEGEWLSKVEEAYVSARQRGQLPEGIERIVGKLHKAQVDWKTLLQRYILKNLPIDYTWARRSKKSISTGYYTPDVEKEKIDVCIGIDTSGSISQVELTEFLSEIIGIAKGYQNRIDMRLFSHDIDVHTDYEIKNGNVAKIMKMEVKGGGGTSHKPIIEKISKEVKDCKCAIFLTDGFSDLNEIDFNKLGYKCIFVINSNGTDEQLKGKNVQTIKLKKV